VNYLSQREIFEIKCTDCGKAATIPFKPTSGKPVYCRTCLTKRRGEKRNESGGTSMFNMKNAWATRRTTRPKKSEEPHSVFQTY